MQRSADFQRGPACRQAGFTILELLVVVGLSTVLTAIAAVAVTRPQAKTSVETSAVNFVSDIKQQQLLSMMGDSGSQTTAQAHGIRVTASNYTVFTGSTFATSTNQFTITLPQGITFSYTTLPLDIIFAKRSGETTAVTGLIIRDAVTDQRTFSVNRLGGVTVN